MAIIPVDRACPPRCFTARGGRVSFSALDCTYGAADCQLRKGDRCSTWRTSKESLARGMRDWRATLTEEFVEDYNKGLFSRREALKRIAGAVGSVVVAESLLAACAPSATPVPAPTEQAAPPTEPPVSATVPSATAAVSSPTTGPSPAAAAPAATVAAGDPAVEAGLVEFPGQGATIKAYLARPKGDGPFPGVLICHENRGLTPHFEELPRRFGKAGYVALAVDLLSREGGTRQDRRPSPDSQPAERPAAAANRAGFPRWLGLPAEPALRGRGSHRHDGVLLRRGRHLALRHPDCRSSRQPYPSMGPIRRSKMCPRSRPPCWPSMARPIHGSPRVRRPSKRP